MSRVYFLQCESSGLIKIGYSSNVPARLSAIQTGSPTAIRLLATEDGGIEREGQLHSAFAVEWVRGEWFRPSEDLLAYIAQQESPNARRARQVMPGTDLDDRALADILGCSRAYPTQMRLGIKPISIEIALKVHAATGHQIGPLLTATDEEIQTLAAFLLAEPYFNPKAS